MKIITEHEVAWDSPDHIVPWGTRRDSTRQLRFQQKLVFLMKENDFSSILDLGCAGGGYISDMYDFGFNAVGIEGSDFSKKRNRAEWARLKDKCLFTADITKKFRIQNDDEIKKFDIITSFEVLEHIKEEDLCGLFRNISDHTSDHALLILSVTTCDDMKNGINLHQTVHPKAWWLKKFNEFGWTENHELINYFNRQYLRGKRFGAPISFEVVLNKKSTSEKPFQYKFAKPNLKSKLIDLYHGSKLHKLIKLLYQGCGSYSENL